MIDPHKPKYHELYWSMARAAASQSVATRHQVGAIVVTPTGMISIGWNGMPSGLTNECEYGPFLTFEDGTYRQKTDPRVVHAERNAIDKMTRQGVPTQGCVLFTTRSPCFECAKALCGLGLKAIYFDEHHDCLEGPLLLQDMRIPLIRRGGL